MADTKLIDYDYLNKYGDPRLDGYPLMKNPLYTLAITTTFFVFVKLVGPLWMKNRGPYCLRWLMVAYNMSLVGLSSWMFLKFGMHGWFTKYNWSCEPIDLSDDPDALEIVKVCWVFYISKIVVFSDTVFSVLRKKDSQLSMLHVFHHCIAPIICWFSIKYGPGGYNTFFMMANCFGHIWMYLYYGLAAMGPAVQKYLWWKKCLTALQMVQFTVVIGYYSRLHFCAPEDCKVSPFLIWFSLSEAILFLILSVLSVLFYISTYRKNAVKGIEKYKRKIK